MYIHTYMYEKMLESQKAVGMVQSQRCVMQVMYLKRVFMYLSVRTQMHQEGL